MLNNEPIKESNSKEINDVDINIPEVQWGIMGNEFYPTTKTTKTIKAGYYGIRYNNNLNSPVLHYHTVLSEKLMFFPDGVIKSIVKDIKAFWGRKENYIKYEVVYKRGILIYGYPGNGKTSIIELISKILIEEHNGIVIKINHTEEFHFLIDLLPKLRNIEKDRKIIIIFEDIDGLVFNNEIVERMLINYLDGAYKIDNVVNIATTNYPEKLKERITNRPSRFDRRYEINIPTSAVREFYIREMIKEDDINSISIEDWVKDTEGFTVDHLKELITSVFVLDYTYKESLETIKNIKENGSIKPTHQSDGLRRTKGFGN